MLYPKVTEITRAGTALRSLPSFAPTAAPRPSYVPPVR